MFSLNSSISSATWNQEKRFELEGESDRTASRSRTDHQRLRIVVAVVLDEDLLGLFGSTLLHKPSRRLEARRGEPGACRRKRGASRTSGMNQTATMTMREGTH